MYPFQRKEKRDIFYMELLSEINFHFIRLNGVWWVVRVSLKINICYLFGTGSKLGKSEELGLKLDFPILWSQEEKSWKLMLTKFCILQSTSNHNGISLYCFVTFLWVIFQTIFLEAGRKTWQTQDLVIAVRFIWKTLWS